MNINKNEEAGNVTYTMPDGATYTVPYKNAEYVVACGGDEVPSKWVGKHYIYMWNTVTGDHDWYCFEEDMSYDTPPWIKSFGPSWTKEDSELIKV